MYIESSQTWYPPCFVWLEEKLMILWYPYRFNMLSCIWCACRLSDKQWWGFRDTVVLDCIFSVLVLVLVLPLLSWSCVSRPKTCDICHILSVSRRIMRISCKHARLTLQYKHGNEHLSVVDTHIMVLPFLMIFSDIHMSTLFWTLFDIIFTIVHLKFKPWFFISTPRHFQNLYLSRDGIL